MIEIREAQPEDIPLIRELTFKVWPQTYSSILSQQQIDFMLQMMYSETALAKQMHEDGCTFILVYENGNPTGFASFLEMENNTWKLDKIYLLHSQQGKGMGRTVLDYIINTIKEKGAAALQLQVNRYNKAKDFYERLGFSVIQIADFGIGNGFFMNDYVMEKKLGE